MSFLTQMNLNPAYCLLLYYYLQEMKYRELVQPKHTLLEFLPCILVFFPVLLNELEKTHTSHAVYPLPEPVASSKQPAWTFYSVWLYVISS